MAPMEAVVLAALPQDSASKVMKAHLKPREREHGGSRLLFSKLAPAVIRSKESNGSVAMARWLTF